MCSVYHRLLSRFCRLFFYVFFFGLLSFQAYGGGVCKSNLMNISIRAKLEQAGEFIPGKCEGLVNDVTHLVQASRDLLAYEKQDYSSWSLSLMAEDVLPLLDILLATDAVENAGDGPVLAYFGKEGRALAYNEQTLRMVLVSGFYHQLIQFLESSDDAAVNTIRPQNRLALLCASADTLLQLIAGSLEHKSHRGALTGTLSRYSGFANDLAWLEGDWSKKAYSKNGEPVFQNHEKEIILKLYALMAFAAANGIERLPDIRRYKENIMPAVDWKRANAVIEENQKRYISFNLITELCEYMVALSSGLAGSSNEAVKRFAAGDLWSKNFEGIDQDVMTSVIIQRLESIELNDDNSACGASSYYYQDFLSFYKKQHQADNDSQIAQLVRQYSLLRNGQLYISMELLLAYALSMNNTWLSQYLAFSMLPFFTPDDTTNAQAVFRTNSINFAYFYGQLSQKVASESAAGSVDSKLSDTLLVVHQFLAEQPLTFIQDAPPQAEEAIAKPVVARPSAHSRHPLVAVTHFLKGWREHHHRKKL